MQCENAYEIAWWKEGKRKSLVLMKLDVVYCWTIGCSSSQLSCWFFA